MIRKFPAEEERVESGPIQFGDDWPGTFLRGDNSIYLRLMLQQAITELEKRDDVDRILTMTLKGYVRLLDECNLNTFTKISLAPVIPIDRGNPDSASQEPGYPTPQE